MFLMTSYANHQYSTVRPLHFGHLLEPFKHPLLDSIHLMDNVISHFGIKKQRAARKNHSKTDIT